MGSSKLVSSGFLAIFAITISCLTSQSSEALWPEQEHEHVPLFVFGDSLYDVGNNNYINTTTSSQANFPPYGQTFFKFPTGRFSDGRVIPDFIAEYANLPLILPYLYPGIKDFIKGVNFASGGAGALDETFSGSVVPLRTQVGYFKEMERRLRKSLGTSQTKKLLSRAVYLIAIGSNDYGAFDPQSKVYQSYTMDEQYVDSVIGNMTTFIKAIYKIGGRKFSVLNVGPIDLLPGIQELMFNGGAAAVEQFKRFTVLHNQKLRKALQKLAHRNLKGFAYSLTDFHTALSEIINHPTKYGMKEVKSGCCGIGILRGTNSCGGKRGIKEYELCANPEEYAFFDATHGTDRVYQLVAEMMWTGTSNITTPLNVKSLFYI